MCWRLSSTYQATTTSEEVEWIVIDNKLCFAIITLMLGPAVTLTVDGFSLMYSL